MEKLQKLRWNSRLFLEKWTKMDENVNKCLIVMCVSVAFLILLSVESVIDRGSLSIAEETRLNGFKAKANILRC